MMPTSTEMADSSHSGIGDCSHTSLLPNEMKANEDTEDGNTRRKKFLFRLVRQLHCSGNLSYRTEEYIRQISMSFNMFASCLVLPVSCTIAFQGSSSNLNPSTCESYTLTLQGGLNCSKLSKLDQICFDILQSRIDFETADRHLQEIEDSVALYPWYVTASAYALAAFSATTMFFGGNWRDGGFALILGYIVYLCGALTRALPGMTEIECFVSSFVATFVATALDKYVYHEKLCLYGQLFGGIVWLLPGITITIAVLELYSNMIVYGSSRLTYGIFLASQMGFGLIGGYRVIYSTRDAPDSFENGCKHPLNPGYRILLLPVMVIATAILMNSDRKQWIGMVLCSGSGQVVSYLVDRFDATNDDFVPVLAAFTVTVIARLYATYRKERPLIYILSGLTVLVPGGIGVRGMSDMWSGDFDNGLDFTFQMVLVSICLAIGIFLALLPRKSWCSKEPLLEIKKHGGALLTSLHVPFMARSAHTLQDEIYQPPQFVKDCDV